MKKVTVFLCAMMFIVGLSGTVGATTFTFQPSDPDLYDLDHYYYYTWGMELDVPENETITGATLFIDDIYNWIHDEQNTLWVHLLDDTALGISTGYDNQATSDAFDGQGILLKQWENLPGLELNSIDIDYEFTADQLATLSTYSSEGTFGLGFDPDCHFYNDGITLTIETTSNVVPEPGTVFLLGVGLVGLMALRRKVWHQR